MGKDVKVSGSGLGDVGGEESEMDLWDAVSLSSMKSSSSAKGFGFSVTGFFEREKRPAVCMIITASAQTEVMVMAVLEHQLFLSILAVVSLAPPLTSTTTTTRRPPFSLYSFLFTRY